MDRVRNGEMRRRVGIERESANRAGKRVLRWLGIWKEWMSTQYGQKGVDSGSKWRASTRETEVWLDGWYEGGLGHLWYYGGG